jgi:hypothetical protein
MSETPITPTIQAVNSPTSLGTVSDSRDTRENRDTRDNKLTTTKLDWNDQTEDLLASWTDVAACYKWLHNASFRKYDNINFGFNIPISIFSTITGVVSVSMTSIVPTDYVDLAQKVVGGVNVLTGILTYFQTYLKFAQQAEAHRHASVGWAKIERNMRIELKYKRENRKDADSFIKVCRSEYDRLVEQSPDIPTDIIQAFKKKFAKHEQLIKPDICDNIIHAEVTKPPLVEEEEIEIPEMLDTKPSLDQEELLSQIKEILSESRLVPVGMKDHEIGPRTTIKPQGYPIYPIDQTTFISKPRKSFLGSPPPLKPIEDLPPSRPSVKDLVKTYNRQSVSMGIGETIKAIGATQTGPSFSSIFSTTTNNTKTSPSFGPTIAKVSAPIFKEENFELAMKNISEENKLKQMNVIEPLQVVIEGPDGEEIATPSTTPSTPVQEVRNLFHHEEEETEENDEKQKSPIDLGDLI